MTVPEYATPEDIHDARPDVPTNTIRRHMRSGVIPGAVKAGRSWIVPVEHAEEYVRTYARYARNDVGVDAHPSDASTPTDPPAKPDEE
jgi:hypothetical protein